MKKIIYALALAILLPVMVAAEAKPAQEVVAGIISHVLEKLTSARQLLDTDPSKIYDLINDVIVPHFDFYSMSKWVLGKEHWHAASEVQQQQFVHEFEILLVSTYAKVLDQYSNGSIEYLPTDNVTKPNLAVVKTKVTRSGLEDIDVTYRLLLKDEQWKVIDMVVDGISLVKSYRGSFLPKIKKDGFEALIAQLSQRNSAALEGSDL